MLILWLLCQSFLLCSAWGESGGVHSGADHSFSEWIDKDQNAPLISRQSALESGHALSYSVSSGELDHTHNLGDSDTSTNSASACCDGKHDYVPSVSLTMIAVALMSFLLLGILFRVRSRHRQANLDLSLFLVNYPRPHIVHCTFLD